MYHVFLPLEPAASSEFVLYETVNKDIFLSSVAVDESKNPLCSNTSLQSLRFFYFVAETMSHNVFQVRNTQIQLMSQQNALHTFFWVLLLLVAGDML